MTPLTTPHFLLYEALCIICIFNSVGNYVSALDESSPFSPSEIIKEISKLAKSSTFEKLADVIKPEKLGNLGKLITGAFKMRAVGSTVRFFLYNDPKALLTSEELNIGDTDSLKKSKYDSSKPLKLLIHAWIGIPAILPILFPNSAKNLYLLLYGTTYNVVIMDYTKTTGYPMFPVAATAGLEEAASQGFTFIKWLNMQGLADVSKVHIIGAGLGAHIGGAIGNKVKEELKKPIKRLTGLDPTGPMFYPKIPIEKVKPPHVIGKEDAEYVDVVHTNALVAGLGIMKDVGHADFYLNGGIMQPGCEALSTIQVGPVPVGLALSTVCSHLIAGELYSFSIWKNQTKPRCACSGGIKYRINPFCCSEKVIFGDGTSTGTKGDLHMKYDPLSFE